MNGRVNVYKLIGLMFGMACATSLLALGRIDAATGASILSGSVMYLVGNGVNAASKAPAETAIIKPAPERLIKTVAEHELHEPTVIATTGEVPITPADPGPAINPHG